MGIRDLPQPQSVSDNDARRAPEADDCAQSRIDQQEEAVMGFLSANWLWIVLIGAMVLMHLRHGRMHGGHHGTATSVEPGSSERGHRHGGC